MAYLQYFLIILRSWCQQPLRASFLLLVVNDPKNLDFCGQHSMYDPYRFRHWLLPKKSGLQGHYSETTGDSNACQGDVMKATM